MINKKERLSNNNTYKMENKPTNKTSYIIEEDSLVTTMANSSRVHQEDLKTFQQAPTLGPGKNRQGQSMLL